MLYVVTYNILYGGDKSTLRKLCSISLNSSIEVPRVGLSNKVISWRSTESGAPSIFTGSSMVHLITTGLSFHSPLYTCKSNREVREYVGMLDCVCLYVLTDIQLVAIWDVFFFSQKSSCMFVVPDVWRRWTCSAAGLESSDHTAPCRRSLILSPFCSDRTVKNEKQEMGHINRGEQILWESLVSCKSNISTSSVSVRRFLFIYTSRLWKHSPKLPSLFSFASYSRSAVLLLALVFTITCLSSCCPNLTESPSAQKRRWDILHSANNLHKFFLATVS